METTEIAAEDVAYSLSVVPPLTFSKHKGQCGRLAVVGGSFAYTGAPVLAAQSAFNFGMDLVHIICDKTSANSIKSYSADFIVHPLLPSRESDSDSWMLNEFVTILDSVHAVLVGPGLGRLPALQPFIRAIIKSNKPTVFDADALFLLTECHLMSALIASDLPSVVLTPNVVELKRISNSINEMCGASEKCANPTFNVFRRICSKNLGIVVLVKGEEDTVVSSGGVVRVVGERGCPRRCGGLGDILAGVLVTLVCWKHMEPCIGKVRPEELMHVSAGASLVTRRACQDAFGKWGRSMTASRVLPFVYPAVRGVFPKVDEEHPVPGARVSP